MPRLSNLQIAEMLEQVAALLELEEADPFRVAAYRYAARMVAEESQPLWQRLASEGPAGLQPIAGVGSSIGAAIEEYLETGRVRMLERLRTAAPADHLFTLVPGIGPDLAKRISEELQIHTLEELELAAHDGRLAAVTGFGARRTQLVRDALAGILARARPRAGLTAAARREQMPPVELVLEIDAEYRRRAAANELKTIAPRRFNSEHQAWLPLMQIRRQEWSFTALFSNTARAHELSKTADWVVIFYARGQQAGQCTVVTERRGLMVGKRVVRGREPECLALYFLKQPATPGVQEPLFPGGAGPAAA